MLYTIDPDPFPEADDTVRYRLVEVGTGPVVSPVFSAVGDADGGVTFEPLKGGDNITIPYDQLDTSALAPSGYTEEGPFRGYREWLAKEA